LAEDSEIHYVLVEYIIRTDCELIAPVDIYPAQDGRDAFAILQNNLLNYLQIEASTGAEREALIKNDYDNNEAFFDLIIVDYKMPVLDGLELISKSRQLYENKGK
jgi:CheY-like chemotaxis protein